MWELDEDGFKLEDKEEVILMIGAVPAPELLRLRVRMVLGDVEFKATDERVGGNEGDEAVFN